MSNVPIARAYRNLLRELVKSSIFDRPSRNLTINASLRTALLESLSGERNRSRALRDVENTTTFLRANRKHQELLERYSPLHDLTEEERIRATARRAGTRLVLQQLEVLLEVSVT